MYTSETVHGTLVLPEENTIVNTQLRTKNSIVAHEKANLNIVCWLNGACKSLFFSWCTGVTFALVELNLSILACLLFYIVTLKAMLILFNTVKYEHSQQLTRYLVSLFCSLNLFESESV